MPEAGGPSQPLAPLWLGGVRCRRCGCRLSGDAPDVQATWNVELRNGAVGGYLCPRCQADAEAAEAEQPGTAGVGSDDPVRGAKG